MDQQQLNMIKLVVLGLIFIVLVIIVYVYSDIQLSLEALQRSAPDYIPPKADEPSWWTRIWD